MSRIMLALFSLASAANIYPDPRLPPIADSAAAERRRVIELQRALTESQAALQQAQAGRPPRLASDTLGLRVSLGCWIALGGASALRFRAGKDMPSVVTLLVAGVGGVVTLVTLMQQLLEAVMRFLGMGPPKIRCHRCYTIFEHPKTAAQVECPQCGAKNAVVQAARKSAFS